MEKEEPDKVSAFKIMLYYATGAALLVIPDWLPMKSTARHQENGRYAIWQVIVATACLLTRCHPKGFY
ncbi:hypothetical protein NXY07_21955 [Phocaeicola dorei]|nr:hypothetical protein [Phocaeicola dorei]